MNWVSNSQLYSSWTEAFQQRWRNAETVCIPFKNAYINSNVKTQFITKLWQNDPLIMPIHCWLVRGVSLTLLLRASLHATVILMVNFSCIIILSTSCENVFRWMPQKTFDDNSTLVQVIAWCLQLESYHLSQCWPRSMSAYGITSLGYNEWWWTETEQEGKLVTLILLGDVALMLP